MNVTAAAQQHAARRPGAGRRALACLVALPALVAACGRVERPAGPPAERVGVSEVPLFAGLGSHTREVATVSADAQRYIDQGLNLLFAFNHDEAIRSFRQAAAFDPDCAMAWWGIALANGPHINNPVVPPDRAAEAWTAVGRARAAAERLPGGAPPSRTGGSLPADLALIDALGARYADPQPEDRAPLDAAYADAMRRAWEAHPRDPDVGALFAEALMDLRPWDLWTSDGKAQPGTDEVIRTLDQVVAIAPDHPLALHLTVHALEMSPNPERAEAAADRLRDLTPGLGHLVHMPSHIDVRRGRWVRAMAANVKAMEADRRYNAQVPRQGFYRVYMAHNHHMYAYGAMMVGQSAAAIKAIDEMIARMPEEWRRDYSAIADGFSAMPLEVRMRFGRWDEILAAPEPPESMPIARALRLYARGVALAAQGKAAEAHAEQAAFEAARAAVPAEAFFGNNPAAALLEVAANMLDGEILFREGRTEAGLTALRRGVEAEDRLRYDEPPDWILPVRHALGAALLESGQHAEAEAVFREDLRRLPDNGWSLFGLARALRLLGKEIEASDVEARFRDVWAGADVELRSSCFCQPGV